MSKRGSMASIKEMDEATAAAEGSGQANDTVAAGEGGSGGQAERGGLRKEGLQTFVKRIKDNYLEEDKQ